MNNMLCIDEGFDSLHYLTKQLYKALNISNKCNVKNLPKLIEGKKVKARVLIMQCYDTDNMYEGTITAFAKIK